MAPRGALAHLPRPSRRGAHQALLAPRQAGRARLLASLPYRVADLYCSCSRHLVITPTKQAGLLTLQIPTTYYLLLLLTTCYYCLLQAGLLMLQIPTGRRPRPFSPSVLVPLPEPLRGRAIAYLREDLGFVCESGLDARAGWEAGSARWMHELGVAFARLDPKGRTCLAPAACNPLQLIAAPHSPSQPLTPLTAPHSPSLPLTALAAPYAPRCPSGRGFLWSANRLQPSMAARNYSQHLLDRFRAFCDALEVTRDGRSSPVATPVTAPAPAAAPPPPPAAPRDAADGGPAAYGAEGLQPRDHVRVAADRLDAEEPGGGSKTEGRAPGY